MVVDNVSDLQVIGHIKVHTTNLQIEMFKQFHIFSGTTKHSSGKTAKHSSRGCEYRKQEQYQHR